MNVSVTDLGLKVSGDLQRQKINDSGRIIALLSIKSQGDCTGNLGYIEFDDLAVALNNCKHLLGLPLGYMLSHFLPN